MFRRRVENVHLQHRMGAMATAHSRKVYQRAILGPLSIALAGLLLGFFLLTWEKANEQDNEARQHLLLTVNRTLATAAAQDGDKLAALLKLIVRDQDLQTRFAARRRDQLFAAADPLYQQLRQDHGVTHFYFITPQRELFLRVHQPERFGDPVQRKTLLDTERSGRVSSGLELGPMGTFTVRVVAPWRDADQRLLGYVELGMELERTLSQLHEIVGENVALLLEKKHLDRGRWEAGVKVYGRKGIWDYFPQHVVVGRTPGVSDEMLDRYRETQLAGTTVGEQNLADGRRIAFSPLPLNDLAGITLGQIVVMRDITETHAATVRYRIRAVGALVVVWLGLMWLARRVINRVYNRLQRAEDEREVFLRKSERDSLTGLFNQATFYRALEREIAALRRRDLPLCVMMIDIDYFKRANDTFGHQAGDAVLRGLSAVLVSNVRVRDSVARYGGEEFAIILPDMGEDAALKIAERIRCEVADLVVEAGEQRIKVTISLGVAHLCAEDSPRQLVARADRALYQAKGEGRNRVCRAAGEDITAPADR